MRDYIFAACGIVLVTLAVYMLLPVKITVEDILLHGSFFKKYYTLFTALALVFSSHYFISRVEDKKIKYGAFLLGFALVVPLVSDFLVFVSVAVPYVFGYFVLERKEEGIKALWRTVSAPRSYATAVLLVLLVIHFSGIKEESATTFKQVMAKIIVEYAGAGSESFKSGVMNALPPGLTEEEKSAVLEELRKRFPGWDELNSSAKEQIIESTLKQYAAIKESIRQGIIKNIEEAEILDEKGVEKMLEEISLFKQVSAHIDIVLAVLYLVMYSIVSWLSSLASFLVLLFPDFVIRNVSIKKSGG